jgi:hypothetical protein
MPEYKDTINPDTNLMLLLKEQNDAGATLAFLEGSEPFQVLAAKTIFNTSISSGALGQVASVNGRTGTVSLSKSDVNLANVPNTDATNANNLSSGTIPTARFPSILPALNGSNLTSLNASQLATGTVPFARGGTGYTTYSPGQLLIGTTAGGLAKATLTPGANVSITNGDGVITISSTAEGSGDVGGPSSSVDNEITLFSGVGGKTIKRASGTGVAMVTSGVLSYLTKPTGDLLGTSAIQTVTNKSISGASNTITNISLSTGVTGNLPVSRLNNGAGASVETYWRGDGTWSTPAGESTGNITIVAEDSDSMTLDFYSTLLLAEDSDSVTLDI